MPNEESKVCGVRGCEEAADVEVMLYEVYLFPGDRVFCETLSN